MSERARARVCAREKSHFSVQDAPGRHRRRCAFNVFIYGLVDRIKLLSSLSLSLFALSLRSLDVRSSESDARVSERHKGIAKRVLIIEITGFFESFLALSPRSLWMKERKKVRDRRRKREKGREIVNPRLTECKLIN